MNFLNFLNFWIFLNFFDNNSIFWVATLGQVKMIIFHLEGAKVTQSAPFTVRTEVSTKFIQLIFFNKICHSPTHRWSAAANRTTYRNCFISIDFFTRNFFSGRCAVLSSRWTTQVTSGSAYSYFNWWLNLSSALGCWIGAECRILFLDRTRS